jgi:hypothetical protein
MSKKALLAIAAPIALFLGGLGTFVYNSYISKDSPYRAISIASTGENGYPRAKDYNFDIDGKEVKAEVSPDWLFLTTKDRYISFYSGPGPLGLNGMLGGCDTKLYQLDANGYIKGRAYPNGYISGEVWDRKERKQAEELGRQVARRIISGEKDSVVIDK